MSFIEDILDEYSFSNFNKIVIVHEADTTLVNTRLYKLKRRLQAIEKAKTVDIAAPGNKPGQDAGTMK